MITPPLLREHHRKGRCFELAGKGLLRDPTWTLVHGWVSAGIPRLLTAHAWLQKEGYVYDPVAS